MRLSQGLLPDMEILEKMLRSILDMNNANKVQAIFLFKLVRRCNCAEIFTPQIQIYFDIVSHRFRKEETKCLLHIIYEK